jgi:hypothetical protein
VQKALGPVCRQAVVFRLAELVVQNCRKIRRRKKRLRL